MNKQVSQNEHQTKHDTAQHDSEQKHIADPIAKQSHTSKQKSDLEETLGQLKKENGDLNEKYLRTLADYQNMVRRVEKEKQEWIKFANENLLDRILDIADNLDRAAAFINDQGLNMVRTQLSQLLAEYGVKELEVAGKEFDPTIMDCVDKVKGEKHRVMEVKQKGYMLHDKILRHAKVVVGE